MATPRIVIKPLRVTDLSDPKVLTIQSGEAFIVENAGSTESYYKRHSDGNLVKLSGGGEGGSGGAVNWNSILDKPNSFYTLPMASSTVLGGVRIGSGLTMNAATGVLSANPGAVAVATSSAAGIVKPGSGLSVTADGTLNAAASALAPATANALGGVKIGSGISVSADGTISAASGGGTGGGSDLKEFTVNFNGAAPGTIANLPTGWTATISGNAVTVTHTEGKPLKQISYWGYSATGGVERYRLPSASNEVTIPFDKRNTQFVFMISTSVAGADTDGSARVVVAF
jgi:hypothetical protein